MNYASKYGITENRIWERKNKAAPFTSVSCSDKDVMAYRARAAQMKRTGCTVHDSARAGDCLILVIKSRSEFYFKGDTIVPWRLLVQTKHKEICRWARKGDSLSFLTLCVFEGREGKGDSNSADWRLYEDNRPCESLHCLPCIPCLWQFNRRRLWRPMERA